MKPLSLRDGLLLLRGAGNRGCHVCCLLTPHPSTPVLIGGLSVHPPALFVRPISLRRASFNPPLQDESLPSATLHVTYHGAGLAHAACVEIGHDALDATFEFGTLARALARHTTKRPRLRLARSPNLNADVRPRKRSTKMAAYTLKACERCGNSDLKTKHIPGGSSRPSVYLVECPCGTQTKCFDTTVAAIKAWNADETIFVAPVGDSGSGQ
jgi:hypothetical protein